MKKKILYNSIYIFVVFVALGLLFWYGSVSNGTFDVNLGGGTPLIDVFGEPQTQLPDIITPEIPDTNPPNNQEPKDDSPDLPKIPEPSIPEFLLHNTVYANNTSVGLIFDVPQKTARFFCVETQTDLFNFTFTVQPQNKLLCEIVYEGETIQFTFTVEEERISTVSTRLTEILDVQNPLFPGILDFFT
ncbi:MAG: hypothetical protein FWH03_07240 [Firmicutes bacterium]|nr:hypothetical protein [Bacillota bacterium]